MPDGAINLNVQGRSVNSPIQGFGKMWQKTYKVTIGDDVTPQEVIEVWKERFPQFWPKGASFYGPIAGIAPGDVALLNLKMPGGVKLSTGVLVMYADEESFTLMTPEGHMFAGWITFSSYPTGLGTVAQAQVLMRASDPLYEMGLTLGGHRKEDKFWEATLLSLASYFGAEGHYEQVAQVRGQETPVEPSAEHQAERCDPHEHVQSRRTVPSDGPALQEEATRPPALGGLRVEWASTRQSARTGPVNL